MFELKTNLKYHVNEIQRKNKDILILNKKPSKWPASKAQSCIVLSVIVQTVLPQERTSFAKAIGQPSLALSIYKELVTNDLIWKI